MTPALKEAHEAIDDALGAERTATQFKVGHEQADQARQKAHAALDKAVEEERQRSVRIAHSINESYKKVLSAARERALREAKGQLLQLGHSMAETIRLRDVLAVVDRLLQEKPQAGTDEAEEAARRWADESRTCGPQPEPPSPSWCGPGCLLPMSCPDPIHQPEPPGERE